MMDKGGKDRFQELVKKVGDESKKTKKVKSVKA